MTNKDNSETNNNPTEKLSTPSNTTNDNFTQTNSEAQKSSHSQEPEDNTKDMDKPNEIEYDAKRSNISTITDNDYETSRYDQVQEDKKSTNTSSIVQGSLLDTITEEEPISINPTELLDDAISIIKELPEGKEKNGGFFRDSLFSKDVRYKNEFKNLKTLPEFFEAFAKIVGNDMKKHTRFAEFKKELLLNDSLPNK